MTKAADTVYSALQRWRVGAAKPLIVGICGAQGCGKSTLAAEVRQRLEAEGVRVAVLSLDDLYLSRQRRSDIAVRYHPLFATRGVPMTHDAPLGERLLENLKAGRATLLPRFDKAADQPHPSQAWTPVTGPVDVVLFEGWCVGAISQAYDDLIDPVNGFEAEHDPDGIWRRYVNQALMGSYARLFGYIDRLVLLAAPDFEVVTRWRTEQEHDLKQRLAKEGRTGEHVMTDDEVAAFVLAYERLTRHILSEMPARADLVLKLDTDRGVTAVISGEDNR
ncbi:kinase [Asticcacaulis sp. ZE23SCel15]|uniref:kinase n=1 Tax=Asticcacaulis sp. ZE23SCel15 TaxID=3059027 RepID=UPI00265DE650|nr:kinase [Asticcacaulis sp. ZE23SCel15]WKL58660.1 kinase [Asticcacaulis sp. ZE23SCel15]